MWGIGEGMRFVVDVKGIQLLGEVVAPRVHAGHGAIQKQNRRRLGRDVA